ncbi:Gfo/Idh/MocA family protein [Actinopolyspora mortivallis]|uniref:Gfo/Idh/MocA family protein n=1 Tax=Actinopolyspora mortivallis TaxID=33906 RepID=UPI000380299C|nr:Gfo/Idh/MocA family oxidoreductase [Actinopolyspora mortivallis]
MIAAIGNSEYLGRRIAPILQELNGSAGPVLVGTDHPVDLRFDAGADQLATVDRVAVLTATDVDAVYVSSATGRHFDDCRAVLAADKDVFVEKPICLRSSEVVELDRMARERNRTVFECLSYPYHPVWSEFVGRVRTTDWAANTTVSAAFRIPGRNSTDFRMAPEHGGAAADLGTYCIDALVRLGASADGIRVGKMLMGAPTNDCGFAIAGSDTGKRNSNYGGLWAIEDEYANSVVVADGYRRIELHRAFTPPPETVGRVVERTRDDPEPSVVVTTEPATSSRACLAAGSRYRRDEMVSGVVDREAIIRRVAALEEIAAAHDKAPPM